MNWGRIKNTIGLLLCTTGAKRADYIRNHKLFYHVGENCMFMMRKVPLHGRLISVGDNVNLASNVTFITHDVIYNMLNKKAGEKKHEEYLGCIKIGDNVFIGANTTILYDVNIASDVIVGADSLVNRSLEKSGVYAGIPAKYICSIEEFLKKREAYRISPEYKDGKLSEDTVKKCWSRFDEMLRDKEKQSK